MNSYYDEDTVAKTGTLIKQPLPFVNNKLPERFRWFRPLIEDMDQYGSYTITDQSLPHRGVRLPLPGAGPCGPPAP